MTEAQNQTAAKSQLLRISKKSDIIALTKYRIMLIID
jgi:hypothetical protein